MEFHYLANHKGHIPELVSWFKKAWKPYYGPNGSGDAQKDLLESCNKNELPIALFALDNKELCGTAALKEQSIATHDHLTPWIAALLVKDTYKDEHLDLRLMALIEQLAKGRGYNKIYFAAESKDERLEAVGWKYIDKTKFLTSDGFVYEKVLT